MNIETTVGSSATTFAEVMTSVGQAERGQAAGHRPEGRDARAARSSR